MPLREEFERSGNWLFRWRSYIPILFIIPVLLGLPGLAGRQTPPPLAWEVLALGVSMFGLLIRIVTVGHAPASTSGRNTREGQVASALNSTGMYSIVRHPLYVGNYFMWLGAALYPGAWWPPVLVTLAFWLYYERIMFAEEEFLRRKFGASYERWASHTPAFVPNFKLWRAPALPFCLRTVLRREYSGLFGMIATFAFINLVKNAVGARQLALDPLWGVALLLTAAIYATLKLLKRRTDVLRVSGR